MQALRSGVCTLTSNGDSNQPLSNIRDPDGTLLIRSHDGVPGTFPATHESDGLRSRVEHVAQREMPDDISSPWAYPIGIADPVWEVPEVQAGAFAVRPRPSTGAANTIDAYNHPAPDLMEIEFLSLELPVPPQAPQPPKALTGRGLAVRAAHARRVLLQRAAAPKRGLFDASEVVIEDDEGFAPRVGGRFPLAMR